MKNSMPFPATLAITAVCGIVYIIIFLSEIAKVNINVDLIELFGNHRFYVLDGEYWLFA